ncbi:amino acid ABC transporter substrate-binding protein [Agromyces sp. ISL-38]|uniref:ABC transporter substrate-binding protein n=1 Tax=Agromyces sp. ISL-38 TaxID=2819107 RepID=UPI001BEC37CB|nr:ABC transporter substrate-binding protein [Agromyces sp. ISL-38]MBT2500241.1 amino acid ABC transporter substrate-binding protein [Agromyces sp. ISL-38]
MTRRSLAALLAAASATLVLAACSAGDAGAASGDNGGGYVTDGKLTIGTGEPAYSPWVLDDAPESGEGFEAAVAYAVADELGFAADDVVWVRTTFEQAIAPGPKDFDFNLQQFSITDEREQAVDFSSPYYETTQVVITVDGSPAASASSIADLQGLLIGAQTGTTSFDAIESIIAPTAGAQVFNTNDDAKLALQNGTVDAIVVDLPTAFYLTSAELDGGKIVGQLPATTGGGDAFGLVLAKDSALTADVTAAVDALRENGTLDALATEWLAGEGAAPVLE